MNAKDHQTILKHIFLSSAHTHTIRWVTTKGSDNNFFQNKDFVFFHSKNCLFRQLTMHFQIKLIIYSVATKPLGWRRHFSYFRTRLRIHRWKNTTETNIQASPRPKTLYTTSVSPAVLFAYFEKSFHNN